MHCFLLAVAQSSTLDRYTNNFSLFFLLEECTPSAYPAKLQVSTHAFFEVDAADRGSGHEVRLAVTRGKETCFVSDVVKFEPKSERHRVRMGGLVLPEPGAYRVNVEWKNAGDDEWTREGLSWPIKANVPVQ